MNRILIIGVSGAGKSTLGKLLSQKTGFPLYHADQFFWKAGWVASEENEFQLKMEVLASADQWIIDGNHLTLNVPFYNADTIIFLDFPRWLALFRAIKRIILYYGRVREDMPTGCPERFDFEHLKYIWNFYKQERHQLKIALSQLKAGQIVFHIKSPKELAKHIENF